MKGIARQERKKDTLDCTTPIDHDDFRIYLSLICILVDLGGQVSSFSLAKLVLLVIVIGGGSSVFSALS